MTQPQLSKRSGLSVSYISALERDEPNAKDGSPRRPRIEKVDKLAKALGADVVEAHNAAGYAAPIREPQTVKELVDRLWEIGIQVNFADDLIDDDSPEALERAKASIAAIMQAQFGRL